MKNRYNIIIKDYKNISIKIVDAINRILLIEFFICGLVCSWIPFCVIGYLVYRIADEYDYKK